MDEWRGSWSNHAARAESDGYCSVLRGRNERAALWNEQGDHLADNVSQDTVKPAFLADAMARLMARLSCDYFCCQGWQRGCIFRWIAFHCNHRADAVSYNENFRR